MPVIDKAVEHYNLNEHYDRALSLVASGRARQAFDLSQESEKIRDSYGRNTFGQVVSLLGVWLRQVPVSLR